MSGKQCFIRICANADSGPEVIKTVVSTILEKGFYPIGALGSGCHPSNSIKSAILGRLFDPDRDAIIECRRYTEDDFPENPKMACTRVQTLWAVDKYSILDETEDIELGPESIDANGDKCVRIWKNGAYVIKKRSNDSLLQWCLGWKDTCDPEFLSYPKFLGVTI